MSEKRLGKLVNVRFGICGYQDACLGISGQIEGDGWGVGFDKSAWDANKIKHGEACQWSEEDRSRQYDEIMRHVSDLLDAAKVASVEKLNGIPVEARFEDRALKDWRILTEVL